jgi:hypothetical protein
MSWFLALMPQPHSIAPMLPAYAALTASCFATLVVSAAIEKANAAGGDSNASVPPTGLVARICRFFHGRDIKEVRDFFGPMLIQFRTISRPMKDVLSFAELEIAAGRQKGTPESVVNEMERSGLLTRLRGDKELRLSLTVRALRALFLYMDKDPGKAAETPAVGKAEGRTDKKSVKVARSVDVDDHSG